MSVHICCPRAVGGRPCNLPASHVGPCDPDAAIQEVPEAAPEDRDLAHKMLSECLLGTGNCMRLGTAEGDPAGAFQVHPTPDPDRGIYPEVLVLVLSDQQLIGRVIQYLSLGLPQLRPVQEPPPETKEGEIHG